MKFICVGRNYVAHAQEMGADVPETPVLFMKPEQAYLPSGSVFYLPDFSNEIHYEVELLIKICKSGKNISLPNAKNHYQEIGLGIDFTARDLQRKLKKEKKPWEIAKAFDHSALVGNFIPKNESNEPINFSLELNQKTVQKGNSHQMIFDFDTIISYASQFFALEQGDIIFTGTPQGVGKITAGDELIGVLNNQINLKTQIQNTKL